MKEYIEFNTRMRAKSKSDLEKAFYKLMTNNLFAKTMDNVTNRVYIKLEDKEFALKQSKKPNFKYFSIVDKVCIVSHMFKQKVKFDKPISVGFSVLDISKLLLYEFYYDKIKKI